MKAIILAEGLRIRVLEGTPDAEVLKQRISEGYRYGLFK